MQKIDGTQICFNDYNNFVMMNFGLVPQDSS